MKDFRLFDITDFIMDEDFIRWVFEKRPADEAFWNKWLDLNPDRHLVIAEARRVLESIQIEQQKISDQEVQAEVAKLLLTIRDSSKQQPTPARIAFISRKWWYAAAILLLVAGGTGYLYEKKEVVPGRFAYATLTSTRHLNEKVNTSDKPLDVVLPDGSTIEVAPNSRVSYPASFDSFSTRDVYLSGEAFFKVAKDPGHPFRVFANEIVTKVLGTSFTIRSFEKDTVIQVTVRTGKVSVYSQAVANPRETAAPGKLGGILLTPNQQLVYEKTGQKFEKVLLDRPVMVVPATVDQSMVYEDTPVEIVFDQMSKAYGINIVFDNELLKKCTVTADLKGELFYRKLDLICRAVGARYEIIDGQVVIQSNGCQ